MTNSWTPNDVLRLIALLGGLVAIGVGIVMVMIGISAEGSLDIRASFASGTLKTGSAGLFVLLVGLMLALGALAIRPRQRPSAEDIAGTVTRTPLRAASALVLVLFAGSLVAGVLAWYADGSMRTGFGLLSGAFAFMLLFALISLLSIVEAGG